MVHAIVIGGGLSGLSAAHTILQSGGSVTLLERNAFMGGNSTKATSGMNGAGTKTQAAMKVPDSKEIFEEDMIRSATGVKTGPCPPPYAHGTVTTHNSADAVHWIQDSFGLALDTVSRLGGHSQPRTHRSKNGTTFPGMEITYALMKKYEELSKAGDRVKLVTKARVNKLVTNSAGAVVGAQYEKDGKTVTVDADAVIVATGGYGAGGLFEGSLLYEIRPDLCHLPTTNGEHCTGDGISFSQAIGAAGIDLEHVQVHPTGLVHMDDQDNRVKFLAAEALRGEGGIIIDKNGERFCNDLGTRDYVTGEMWKHDKAPYRLVLNENAYKNIAWHCKHYCGRRVMKNCSGDELAKDIGIPTAALQKSFDSYNAIAIKKNDPWGKKFFNGTPFSVKDKFMAAVVTPVVHYTMGGLNVSPEAECMHKASGAVLPGLYAAGEVTGGIHGRNRLGGSALLECVVWGRVAGKASMEYMKAGPPTAGAAGAPGSVVTVTIPQADGKSITVTVSGAGIVGSGEVRPPKMAEFCKPQEGKPSTSPIGTNAAAKAAAPAAASAAGGSKEYTLEEVGKHKSDKDCWVVVNGEVLDVTKFLPDHPGGKMAIMAFAGRDATEEFNMVHEEGIVQKYASDTVIGKLKMSSKL